MVKVTDKGVELSDAQEADATDDNTAFADIQQGDGLISVLVVANLSGTKAPAQLDAAAAAQFIRTFNNECAVVFGGAWPLAVTG